MKIVFDTRAYIEKVWVLLQKVPLDKSLKSQFVGSMLFSTFNICDGMQMLIQQRNFVSSNILVRSLFEYTFRSFWLSRIASDEDIQNCMKNDCWPTTLNLHNAIQGKSEIIDILAKEKLKLKEMLHSFTHGGNQNPLYHLGDGNYITPNIPNSEILYFLRILQLSMYFVMIELVYLSGTNQFNLELEKLSEELIEIAGI